MSTSPYLINPNILAHPDRIVHNVELDMEAQETYLAGSPISALGKLANDETAFGVLLYDVHKSIGGHVGTVVISGYIQQDVAAEWSGITISDAAKSAMINVLFTDDGSRAGVSSWNELEDKPFDAEETIFEILPETVVDSPYFTTFPELVIGDTYIITFQGEEYTCQGERFENDELRGVCLGDPNGGSGDYVVPFAVISLDADLASQVGIAGMCMLWVEIEDAISFSIQHCTEIVQTIDPKFLPKASAVADVTAAPTAAEFNALLAALRAAGYMAK